MSMLDALIAQIQAAPDDDAPRLAWANAVGGERGEFVELQCRLASGPLTDRDEFRRLRARERELLFANGVAWSGLAGEYPSLCTFRRGFVESAASSARTTAGFSKYSRGCRSPVRCRTPSSARTTTTSQSWSRIHGPARSWHCT